MYIIIASPFGDRSAQLIVLSAVLLRCLDDFARQHPCRTQQQQQQQSASGIVVTVFCNNCQCLSAIDVCTSVRLRSAYLKLTPANVYCNTFKYFAALISELIGFRFRFLHAAPASADRCKLAIG